ncbi:MAG: putative PEP-binding protein, partial [Pseudomonadota bacterium]
QALEVFRSLVDRPATTRDGTTIALKMNAGVLADLPSLQHSGAQGVGLYRTELQFMIRQKMPRRESQAGLYKRVMDAAGDAEVIFRTLDIGSDKVLPYMRREREANPALGWRAIRVGLDRPHLLAMQIQALIRAAEGRPLSLMFPMISTADEFYRARDLVHREIERRVGFGDARPRQLQIGMMFEVPALISESDRMFAEADFISVGGNDLLQFFFAADRENEKVRPRYDVLTPSFLRFLEQIIARCAEQDTRLSFCGEAAGRPLEAIALAALGFRDLSMRAAAIGPVKQALIEADLSQVRDMIAAHHEAGHRDIRAAIAEMLGARLVREPGLSISLGQTP